MHRKLICFSVMLGVLGWAIVASASQCVTCHTDVNKLKAIAKTIPKPVASAETAGKG